MSLRSGTQAGRASFKLFVHVGECRYGRGLRASGVRTPARNLTRSVSGRSAAAAAAPMYTAPSHAAPAGAWSLRRSARVSGTTLAAIELEHPHARCRRRRRRFGGFKL